MSDSENEFGGFSKTTPDTKKLPTRMGNATAGPSRTAATTNGKRKPVHSESDDDVQEVQAARDAKIGAPASKRKRIEVARDEQAAPGPTTRRKANGKQVAEEDNQSEEVQELDVPPSKKPHAPSKKPAPKKTSGNTSGTEATTTAAPVKGKGKVKPHPTASAKPSASKQPTDDVLEVIDSDDEDNDEHEGSAVDLAEAITKAHRSKKSTTRLPRKEKPGEATHLEEQLEQANTHIEELKRQLEELHQIRVTEPELLLKRMETQYEADRQARERLVEDMEKQLQRKDPLLRPNKESVFELLTRDEADKEMQDLKEQVKQYKEAIRERDQQMQQKDDEVKELHLKAGDLKTELQMEIERGKQLLAKANQRPPNSAQKPQSGKSAGMSENPHIRELTRFYEDLTNVVVLKVKPQKSDYFNLEDWVLLCVYTYQDLINPDTPTKALTFNLRLCKDPISGLEGKPKSEADLVDYVHFLPLDLEKESEEFVESLQFLKGPFAFERTQLSLFLRTLHDILSGEGNKDQPDSDIEVVG